MGGSPAAVPNALALVGLACLFVGPATASAAEIHAAVAANFTRPAEELAAAFTAKTGDTVIFSFGATGALYAQISQGAPFEVFLAADAGRPAQAVTDGFGVEGTGFSYAVGKVVLYSPSLDLTDGEAVLRA
ncbi:MAG TPA: molybdate ABC transporter substrate-binding protein, partial [Devosia sp.]